jgi:hypothetical protein
MLGKARGDAARRVVRHGDEFVGTGDSTLYGALKEGNFFTFVKLGVVKKGHVMNRDNCRYTTAYFPRKGVVRTMPNERVFGIFVQQGAW